MLVEQIWTDNPLRNFHYLVACPETLEALAIDPYDHQLVLQRAEALGWKITQIVNTHEHFDHIDGNQAMVAATGAKVLAHANARGKIAGMDTDLGAGSVISIGSSVTLDVLDTPGHTMSHICLLSRTEVPALFSGDTLFNAGVGHCHSGGDPDVLAHDYMVNNLRFTLDREPHNAAAQQLLQQVEFQDPNHALITNLGLEKQINTFFRTDSAEIRENLSQLNASATPKDVFLALRQHRNSW